MIDQTILDWLRTITQEECAILNGDTSVDWGLYIEQSGNIINAKKLLDSGKLITIRPHTRFIHFPPHTHDYVELVYMCQGSTTHIANGTRIELRQGELLFFGQGPARRSCPQGRRTWRSTSSSSPPFLTGRWR